MTGLSDSAACEEVEADAGKDFNDLFTASKGREEAKDWKVKSLSLAFNDGSKWLGGG